MKTYKSLQYRLLAAFFLISALVLVALAAILYFTTIGNINKSYDNVVETRNEGFGYSVLASYVGHGNSWDNIQTVIEEKGIENNLHITLVDMNNIILANSRNAELIGQEYYGHPDETSIEISLSLYAPFPDENYVTLYVGGPGDLTKPDQFFGYFFIGCALALGIAIIFSAVISRRILEPINKITLATERLAGGNLDTRVDVEDNSELGQLADTFNEMAAEIERTHRNNKEMVADIAHELRTPLTTITGYLEAIQDGIIKPDKKTINSLVEEAESLARLVSDLKQLSVAETSSLALNIEEIDMNVLLQRAYLAKQHEASQRGISVEYEETALPHTMADPQRIYQVINNLLNNAISHTAEGTVLMRASHDDKNIKVSIIDTGVGIPEEELANIFERFYRVDKSRARKTGGTGLGLTIAKTLVLGHKGHIGVESVVGKGSRFWFTIPIKTPPKKKKKMEDLM